MPLLNVEVAEEVFKIDPPVIESPLEETNPAADAPPAKVEVEVVSVVLKWPNCGALVYESTEPFVVRIVEEAPTAVRPVPPFVIPRVPDISLPPSSIVCPRLVKQVPPCAIQPAVTLIPLPVKVEVAEELFKIEPPVIVRPLVDKSPLDETPPAKEEVAESPPMVVVDIEPT